MFTADVEDVLIKVGLRENEGKVYLTLLQNNPGLNVAKITQITSLKRSTINLILDRLIARGFVSFHIEEAHKVFNAEDPSRILLNLEDTVTDLKNIIPLLSTSKFGGIKSQVRFFDGSNTVSKIHRDIILATKYSDHKELLAFSSGADLYEADSENVEKFVKERVKTGLFLKWIAPEDEFTKKRFISTSKDELREVKFFNKQKYPFNIQINIYANCVALISLKSNMSGAIIENAAIADSFRALFNLLWDSLK